MFRHSLLILFLILQSASCFATELFDGLGRPAKDYRSILGTLEPGESLFFRGTGVSFSIEEILHHPDVANFTAVYDIGSKEVLRLASHRQQPALQNTVNLARSFRSQGHFQTDGFGGNSDFSGANLSLDMGADSFQPQTPDLYLQAIQNFQIGWEQLKGSDLPTVKVNEARSHSPIYFVVEKVDIVILADEWVTNWNGLSEQYPHIEQHWLEFVERTWQFKKIGDFKLSQIGYDGTQWRLIDFWSGNIRHLEGDDLNTTVFDGISGVNLLPQSLQDQMISAIREKRMFMSCEKALSRPTVQN